MSKWYESKTGNDQGLVIDEITGSNVAVTYDRNDAALMAAAPELLALAEAISFDPYALTPDQWANEARQAMADITGE